MSIEQSEKELILRRLPAFSLSLVVHILLLLGLATVTWYAPEKKPRDIDTAAIIALQGLQADQLQFQGTDELDSFEAQDHMVYPLDEVDYRPVLPEMKFLPEATIKHPLDLVGIESTSREWLETSSGRQPLYTGEEKLTGSFTRHIQVLREGGLDIVFVFDSTSSMAQVIRQVKYKIENLITVFKQLVPTSRVGLVTYRDSNEAFVTRSHPLSHGTISLNNFLRQINAEGGGDYQEAIDEGLRVAIQDMNWRPKAKKIIVLMGDAPPHAETVKACTSRVVKFRQQMNGMVSALDTTPDTFKPSAQFAAEYNASDRVMPDFRLIADLGGGEAARLSDVELLIRQMVVMVFGSRWEICLDEFMKNL
jgi:hypothetical protein